MALDEVKVRGVFEGFQGIQASGVAPQEMILLELPQIDLKVTVIHRVKPR
jgi:hypothetical protein